MIFRNFFNDSKTDAVLVNSTHCYFIYSWNFFNKFLKLLQYTPRHQMFFRFVCNIFLFNELCQICLNERKVISVQQSEDHIFL